MKLKPIHLFLILLTALLLTCCLGNNSVLEGMSSNRTATIYTGPQGGSATVVNSNNQAYNDEYNNNQYSSTSYQGPQGNTATVYTGPQGNAFYLLGTAMKLCKQIGLDVTAVLDDLKGGDYEHLITRFDYHFGFIIDLER